MALAKSSSFNKLACMTSEMDGATPMVPSLPWSSSA